MLQMRRCLVACIAGVVLVWALGAQSQAAQQSPAPTPGAGAKPGAETTPQVVNPQVNPPVNTTPQATPAQQDLATLSELVDAVSAGQQATPSDVPVRWVEGHFIKSQGDIIYIPFTVAIDRARLGSPAAALYLRVVSQSAPAAPPAPGVRPDYPWDTIHFVDVPADGRLSRAIALPPGTYDAFVAVKDKGAAVQDASRIGLLRQTITVPSFAGQGLDTSSIILAEQVEPLAAPPPAEQQQDNPYTFGTLKITPSFDGMFSKSGQLDVLFWIYNASHTGGKPDVQVEYQFHHRMPGGELKYFNKTAPQPLNAETLPPEFDLTQGHQLLSSLAIPLSSFPEGDYRLEITITDKSSGTPLIKNVDFTVSA